MFYCRVLKAGKQRNRSPKLSFPSLVGPVAQPVSEVLDDGCAVPYGAEEKLPRCEMARALACFFSLSTTL